MSEDTEDTKAPKKKSRKRRTFAERKAEMEAKLAKLEAQAAKAELEEAIESGECADPEKAKKLSTQIRALGIARRTLIDLNIVSEEDYNNIVGVLNEEIQKAVHGEE